MIFLHISKWCFPPLKCIHHHFYPFIVTFNAKHFIPIIACYSSYTRYRLVRSLFLSLFRFYPNLILPFVWISPCPSRIPLGFLVFSDIPKKGVNACVNMFLYTALASYPPCSVDLSMTLTRIKDPFSMRNVPRRVVCFVPRTLCVSVYVLPCAFVLVLAPPLSCHWSVTCCVHLFCISLWLFCLFITCCSFVPCKLQGVHVLVWF